MRAHGKDVRAGRRRLSGLSTMVLCAAGAAFGAAGAPSVALAQDAQAEEAQAEDSQSDEIVVTARRREERLQDVPVAITALSGEQLEGYNVTSIGDITSFVPSMVVGRQVTGSSSSIFLRGVGSSSLSAGFDQSVSFNLDGLAMSRGREILFSQYDISSVEVLKGPQALYFGRNTTGGLVSVTTNGPSDEFEASGRFGFGFEADETYAEGVISGPLSDTVGARLAFRGSNSEGAFTNTAGPGADFDGLLRQSTGPRRGANESLSARLTLDYHPTDAFSLILKAGLTDYSDDGAGNLYERVCGSGRTTPRPSQQSAAAPLVSDPYADCAIDGRSPHSVMPAQVVLPAWRYVRDGVPYTDLSSSFAIVNGRYDMGAVELHSITGYYQFKQEDLNDFLGATRTNGVTQLADYDQFSQELRLQSDLSGPLNFMAGLYYSDSEFIFNTDVYISSVGFDPVNQTYNTFNRDNGFDATTLSVFAEGVWDILPTLELSGGARWSRDERDSFQLSLPAHSALAGVFPPGRRFEDSFEDENISPQVTLSWRPNRDVSWYVGYKEGYKTGGYNLSQTILASTQFAAGQFGSETASGWEAGVRSTLFAASLRLNATIYDYTYEDLQVQFYNPVTSGQVVSNAGELQTTGAEVDFNWFPNGADGFSLHGAVAYNDAQYDNFFGQCWAGQVEATGCNRDFNPATGRFNSQDFAGRTPPKAPEWSAQLGGAYEVSLGDSLMGRATLDANYTSEYNYTDTLRPDGVQEAFTRIDASVALFNPDRGWQLSLIGRNLTDELVIATANDMTGTGAGAPTGSVGNPATITPDMNAIIERPREVYLELSFEF
ncbi:MAG: TonB-dependent receptor [Hydrogenophilaceae bacterium]|nr:TonB-dependent receptor [Hydrogenophilaceae bacterium]